MIYDTPQANEDNNCPDGYKACSSKTKHWFDVVCIKKSESANTNCPILKTRFYNTETIADLGDEWQSTRFDDTLSIAWTKTDSSSGPLERTFLGTAPCSDPSITTTWGLSNTLYKQEVQKLIT